MKLVKKRLRHNLTLFILCFFYVFVLGILPIHIDYIDLVYSFVMTLVYFAASFSVQDTWSRFSYLPFIIVSLAWVSKLLDFKLLEVMSLGASFIYFFYIVVFLLIRVASSKEVGKLEFIESINVYLLLGIAASTLFAFINEDSSMAFATSNGILDVRSDFIYYSFVTLTTLGYGDITPINPIARSVSIFFSVAGQLYLTMIIAMLVGKYLNKKNP